MLHNVTVALLLVAALLAVLPADVSAQDATAPIVRAQVQADGQVWVYHTQPLPLGYGFNLYRNDGSGFARLNDDPVYGASTGEEVLQFMDPLAFGRLAHSLEGPSGEDYRSPASASEAGEAAAFDPHEVLFNVRSSPLRSGLATFLYPGMARALARLYVDDQAPSSGSVTYRFEFVDASGDPSGETLEGTVVLQPSTPARPTNLRAENEGTLVTLEWSYPVVTSLSDDDGVAYFDVYQLPADGQPGERVWLNDRPIVRLGNETDYAFRFEAPMDTTLVLAVEAVDIGTQRSEQARLTFTTLDNVPPHQVQNVATRVLERDVHITWTPLDAAEVVGYRLYRSDRVDSAAVWTPLHDEPLHPATNAFRDTTLTAYGAQTWFYRVVSLDDAGNEGPPSASAMAQVEDHTPPDPITDLEAVFDPEANVVRLAWQDENPAPDLQTYTILRRRVERGAPPMGVVVNPEDLLETRYVDPGPDGGFPEGTPYRYTVTAVDATRNSSASVWVTVEVPNRTPPPPPDQVIVQPEDGYRIVVTWGPSPAVDVAAYVLARAEASGPPQEIARLPQTGFRFEDRDAATGVPYTYTVWAVDEAGNEGPPSPGATLAVSDTDAPRQVRNVRAVAEAEGVVVTWEPVPDDDLAGYRVWRMTVATGIPEVVQEELVPAGTTRLVDPEGTTGLFYHVTAYDASGNHSRPSQTAQAVIVQ